MGLRINTNIPSLVALRNLSVTDTRLQGALQRLATGLRINRAADDPTGLAVSESLRSEIRALKQATENSRAADNLLTTADAALSEVNSLLNDIRSSVIFAMDGTATEAQIAAEQSFVDQALGSLSRIAATTRFGDVPLLNGQSGFTVESVAVAGIRRVLPTEVRFNPVADPTAFSLGLTAPATQATTAIGSGVVGGPATLSVTGPNGTTTLDFAAGATAADVASAIDSVRGFVGIFAVGTTLFTEKFGEAASIRLENIAGTGTVNGLAPGGVLFVQGTDAVATLAGAAVTGVGNTLSINTSSFSGTIELQPGAPAGTYGFDVRRSGLLFQLGALATSAHQATLGIPNMDPASLGLSEVTIGGQVFDGFLSSLQTGQPNDLTDNPENALRILDLALSDIGSVRSTLGSFTANVVQTAERTNEVAAENLSAAESQIRDADFAVEIAEQTRDQILLQSGIGVLAQANAVPQSVLRLLER